MQFSNSFNVSLPPADAWRVLMNIPAIAPCMPGAELTEVVDPETYKGKVAVRMGPVVLAFAGVAKFEERDDVAHTARVKAQGTDSKGRGGANATASFRLEPSGSGSKVLITTDLNLSGSVAQYGRSTGMIQTIAAQLINQFAKSLEKQIASSASGDAQVADAASSPQGSAAKPIGAFSLVAGAMWTSVKRPFGAKNEDERDS
jgi:carbon monoxide dehydrogenase subunit G